MEREREIDLVEEDEVDEVDEVDEDAPEIGVDETRGWGAAAFVGGLVVGALVGAGVALLLAPESGEATRRRVRRKLEDVRDGAREQIEDARDQLDDWRDDAHRELRRRRHRRQRRLKGRA